MVSEVRGGSIFQEHQAGAGWAMNDSSPRAAFTTAVPKPCRDKGRCPSAGWAQQCRVWVLYGSAPPVDFPCREITGCPPVVLKARLRRDGADGHRPAGYALDSGRKSEQRRVDRRRDGPGGGVVSAVRGGHSSKAAGWNGLNLERNLQCASFATAILSSCCNKGRCPSAGWARQCRVWALYGSAPPVDVPCRDAAGCPPEGADGHRPAGYSLDSGRRRITNGLGSPLTYPVRERLSTRSCHMGGQSHIASCV